MWKYRIKGQLCIIKRLYNRNIKLTNSGNFELEIINFYTLKDLFTNPISSREVGYFVIKKINDSKNLIISIDHVLSKCILLPFKNKYVAIQLL